MTFEISIYIQTERKQKFVGRFECVLNSAVVSSKDITKKVLEYVSRSVPSIRNPEEARVTISLPESQGGVKLTSKDKIGTSCGGAHLIATYKNFGEPDVEAEREHTIEEMLATGNTKFYSLVARDPYNPNADPQCFNVSAQMPVNKVLNKVRELYYRPDFVGEHPTQCGMMVSFGAPSRDVEMEETITVTKDEMEKIMKKIRDDIIAERLVVESSDDEPLVMPLNPQNEVIAPPQVPFNAFSGTGLKLGEPDEPAEEPKVAEIVAPKVKVDEGVASSSDRWESDGKPIPLNEKNEVNCNEFYLKLHGKTVYTYYAKKGENFMCLFSLLQSVGINVGSPDTSSEYTLGYASSKAYKHEFLDDWGGKGSTYVLVPRQLGGGVLRTIQKSKGSPRSSAKNEKTESIKKKVGEINEELSGTTFLAERVADISVNVSERMKELYKMIEDGNAMSALKMMLVEMSDQDLSEIALFSSSRSDDRLWQVKDYLLRSCQPNLIEAYESLGTVKASCEAVIELAIVGALTRESGEFAWKSLEAMVSNELEVRARVAKHSKQ